MTNIYNKIIIKAYLYNIKRDYKVRKSFLLMQIFTNANHYILLCKTSTLIPIRL